ncbi:MAG: hypothetical protein ACR2NN_03145 [Bryobacteraceae bacterium]
MEGRKTVHPGPIADSIRHECTLELIAIKKGSTTLQFDFAKPQLPLDLDIDRFGIEVVGELANTIKLLGNGRSSTRQIEPGVLQGLYGLGSASKTNGISDLEWIAPKAGTRKRVAAPLNEVVRERVAERLSSPRKEPGFVDGILDMADFKPKDRRCRIDPAIGASVTCTFDAEFSDRVQALMRKPVRVIGEATVPPYTNRIETLHIQEIALLASLSVGEGNFFAQSSISQLAQAQNVKAVKDVSVLVGGFPDEENIDNFLDEIYNSRT